MTDFDLFAIIQDLLNNAQPAQSKHYETRGVGFWASDDLEEKQALTVICLEGSFHIVPGIHDAVLVICANRASFEKLRQGKSVNSEDIVFIPHDNRLYLPPPLRPFFDHIDFDDTQPFAMPHRYPTALNKRLWQKYEPAPLPAYDASQLPQLVAEEHPEWVEMYNYAWQRAFQNLRQPEIQSGFIANYIDTAFNDNTFLWDSCFMTMFGRYGRQLFDFMGTLDNFYAKQHANGFICREINTYQGYDLFLPNDPRATGPNIFAWTEWLDYQLAHDSQRLRAVFPALVAYHQWWHDWQRWPDGSYWTSGLGSGMDNQQRVPDSGYHHRFYAWLDATCQQALSCKILLEMADVLDWHEFDAALREEYDALQTIVNQSMWDEATGFYYDRAPNRTLSTIKSIGAYWGLLAGIFPAERAARMIEHLEDASTFNRPHRIPSQAADGDYRADGSYWRGGVWSPTNYMVLQALLQYENAALAHEIARNHVEAVAAVYQDTGTLWETYAPERFSPGSPAKPNFVGWTGLSAITIPIEHLIGLRWQAEHLLWDIRLMEAHGVLRYPLGIKDSVDLRCAARASSTEAPQLHISSTTAIELLIRWGGGEARLSLAAGDHHLQL